MSRELWEKLQVHRHSKLLPPFLAQVKELRFVGFLDADTRLVPQYVTEQLFRLNIAADAQFDHARGMSRDSLDAWLRGCLVHARIDKRCYLKLDTYGYAPWANVEVAAETAWLLGLFDHLVAATRDLSIVSGDKVRLLRFDDAEYSYEARFRDIRHGPHDAMAF